VNKEGSGESATGVKRRLEEGEEGKNFRRTKWRVDQEGRDRSKKKKRGAGKEKGESKKKGGRGLRGGIKEKPKAEKP